MLDVLSLAREDTHLKKEATHEYSGSCPGCGGNDRFRVRWSRNAEGDDGQWRFMCRNCWHAGDYLPDQDRKRGWGDAIAYLRHFKGKSFQEAKRLVEDGEGETSVPSPGPIEPARRDYTSQSWQETVAKAMHAHIERLWSDEGLPVLKYLHSRGLYGEIVTWSQLGYSAAQGIPRLIVPSMNDGHYATIHRRDLRPDRPEEVKPWSVAPGFTGAGDQLYLADSLKRKLPTVLCEGPLDALTVHQECGRDGMNAVATGGITKCHDVKWIARLARMPIVLVAFDAESEKGKGDDAAKWWLERLPNARRLRPWLHDVNEMLVEKWDVEAWITEALEKYEDVWLNVESPLCATCLDAGQTVPALEDDHEGLMYCAAHHPMYNAPEIHDGIRVIAEKMSNEQYLALLKREKQQERAAQLAQEELARKPRGAGQAVLGMRMSA
jgi:DNA primase